MSNKLVIGLGISGRAAAKHLFKKKHKVWGVDQNSTLLRENPEIQTLLKEGLHLYSNNEMINILDFDQVIVSPGIPQTHPLYVAALHAGIEVIGEIELGCREIVNKVIGITGTNGKTTATLWTAQMLNRCGVKARALGNVGTPLCSELENVDPNEVLILELSSYQLETLHSPILDIAVILNITPDHLDRYQSMEAYAAAKWLIAKSLKSRAPLYIEERTLKEFPPDFGGFECRTYGYNKQSALFSDLKKVYFQGLPLFELPLSLQKKSHDLENLLAVYAICQELQIDPHLFASAIHSLKKPPHRIEWIAEIDGVNYYDDSKGTNIDAVTRAVQSLPGPIILIAGGVDKGAPYTPWINFFSGKVKSICTIGQAAAKIQDQLSSSFSVYPCKSLEEAVSRSVTLAQPGDSILLSPGCSSFDMFQDYAHRGKVFQDLVKNLCLQKKTPY
jgi:UDP-N-acetylmuramoylalanine--D-glutamate ligase